MAVSQPYNGSYAVTQIFGVNPDAYARFGLRGHNGEDIGLPQGTPLYAPDAGVVRIGHDPPGYGDYVRIIVPDTGDPANGMWLLAHMSRIDVVDGEYVTAGQYLGLSGGTPGTQGHGNSSGPHVHIGYRPYGWTSQRQNGFDGFVDPAPVLAGSAYPEVASPVTGQPDVSDTLPYDPQYPPALTFQPSSLPALTPGTWLLAAGGALVLAVWLVEGDR